MKPNFSFKYGEKEFSAKNLCGKEAGNSIVYDLGNGVSVCLEATEHKKYDAVEWVLWFENTSDKNSLVFSDICDCDTLLPLNIPQAPRTGYNPREGDTCIITMNGCVDGHYYWENDKVSATEFNLTHEYLSKAWEKRKTFENIHGRSSDGMMPLFDITASGDGYIAAIGWTGDWKADFSELCDGVNIKTGLRHAKFYLKPGEKLRTSSILIMKYTKNEDKYNKFRRLIKNHFSHKAGKPEKRTGIMACELWGGLTSDEMKKRLNEFASYGIHFEDVWIDAGWYGNCTKCDEAFSGDWSYHTGNWVVNERVHPDKLMEVSECAKAAGMNLMLWFEPERVILGTPVTKEHPEWFIKLPDNGSAILNYGNEEAAEYVYTLLSDYIEKLGMSCYRQDFNAGLTDYFEKYDEEDRRGVTEIKHITGMYKLWDRLHEKFPHLLIDNCSSGGRRIDIETLKRSIPFFRSDYQCSFNENSEVLQTHNSNISKYLPFNGCTSKTKSDTYAIRSSFSSSWGGAFYNAIFQSMDEGDFQWAKKATDEYRYIRKYLSEDFYNHGSSVYDDTSWAIWQYNCPETQSGIVMAFRRTNSPFESVEISLSGLCDGKEYSVTNLDNGTTGTINGKLRITLPEKRSCVILEYKIK